MSWIENKKQLKISKTEFSSSPITSYGIILIYPSNPIKILMIRRKDTFGYIDFIRGKYSCSNRLQLQEIIDQMTMEEKSRIIKYPFEILWNSMWTNNEQLKNQNLINKDEKITMISSKELNESNPSKQKFLNLLNSSETKINIYDLIKNSTSEWLEQEWEFPKGRKKQYENEITCAKREFTEETGIEINKICILNNVNPLNELFHGTNHKTYLYKYFLAIYTNDIQLLDITKFQQTEVSNMEWKTLDECRQCIRPYNKTKLQIIDMIEEFCNKSIFCTSTSVSSSLYSSFCLNVKYKVK